MMLIITHKGCYRLYNMSFVEKNKRIVLKMLTANSKNTNTTLAISSTVETYDWLVAYYSIQYSCLLWTRVSFTAA